MWSPWIWRAIAEDTVTLDEAIELLRVELLVRRAMTKALASG